MTNVVDTSEETISAEFDAAEQEIGTEETTQETPQPDPMEEAQREAELAMASAMIANSLRFAVGSFSGVAVNDDLYQQTADAYAVLIIKYFPGGIFALLDRYKEELSAATATFVLIRTVSAAKAKKLEEEEAKRKADAASKKTTFAPDNKTEESETTNGNT